MGRPKKPRANYAKRLHLEVTPERWTAIVRKAVEQAMEGDAQARSWLSKLLIPDVRALQHEIQQEGKATRNIYSLVQRLTPEQLDNLTFPPESPEEPMDGEFARSR